MTEADTSGTRGRPFSSDTDVPSMWSSSAAEPGFTRISAITSITSTTTDSSNKRESRGPGNRDAPIHDASSISMSSISDLSSIQNSTTNHLTTGFSEDEEYEEDQEEEREEENDEEEEEQEKENDHPTTGLSEDEEYEEGQEEEKEDEEADEEEEEEPEKEEDDDNYDEEECEDNKEEEGEGEEMEEEGEEAGRYTRVPSPSSCASHLRSISSPEVEGPRKRMPKSPSTKSYQETNSLRRHLPRRPCGVLMLVRWGQEPTKCADDTSLDVSSSIYDWPWPPITTREIAVQASPPPNDSEVSTPVTSTGAFDVFQDLLNESANSRENEQKHRATGAGDTMPQEEVKIPLMRTHSSSILEEPTKDDKQTSTYPPPMSGMVCFIPKDIFAKSVDEIPSSDSALYFFQSSNGWRRRIRRTLRRLFYCSAGHRED
ncbi:unnamed protein product [Dibothriocephalus latus]|uniref:Uncharacterized protein n=1 Tax=Dibothriocephalus latus TaxID=60516 RepID=A0A3P7MWX6_DIBLA|nr:unnamed protein product [Dibothriocephalus latus]